MSLLRLLSLCLCCLLAAAQEVSPAHASASAPADPATPQPGGSYNTSAAIRFNYGTTKTYGVNVRAGGMALGTNLTLCSSLAAGQRSSWRPGARV